MVNYNSYYLMIQDVYFNALPYFNADNANKNIVQFYYKRALKLKKAIDITYKPCYHNVRWS